MASIAQMKAEAASQGATAPPDYPGGEDQWVQDWYANAKAAGSIASERPANYAGPNDAEAQGHNYSQNVSGQSGWQPGQSINPQQLRQLSREQGWSENFNRYSDAQLQAWINQSWDPQSGRFRSEGGGGALVEKPTECPPGTTLHGSKCVGWNQLPPELGGTAGMGGGPAAPGAAPAAPSGMASSGDPLQDALVRMYQERGGAFAGSPAGQSLSSGGIWWTGSGGALPVAPAQQAQVATQAAAAQAAQPAQQQQPAAPTSALANQNSAGTSALANSLKQITNGVVAPRTGTPLVQNMAQQQRAEDPNAWWKRAPLEV